MVQQAAGAVPALAPGLPPPDDTLVGRSPGRAAPAHGRRPQSAPRRGGRPAVVRDPGRPRPRRHGRRYRARQAKLNRVVAAKMVLGGSHAGHEDLARFLTEAEAVAAIQHPGIVQVYDFGTHDGLPFLAMELCPGGSLAQKLAGAPLAPKAAADLVSRLARAAQAAHDKGIVHRDLKPANILLAADGSPRITDFGLAKRVASDGHLTRTGALLGTPSYMAPEQATASKHTGPPADIYALGAILYECLTGRPPFRGATAVETLRQVVEAEPVSIRSLQPKVPRDLETICHKALRKEPARRYATAADLAADLDRFLAGEPVLARPVGPVRRGWKWVQRRPVVAGLFAAFVLSLVVGAAATSRWALIAGQRERLARQREQEVREALDVAGRIAVLLASNVLAPIEPPELNREGLRNKGMSPAELGAIEELARLPPQIDRVELIRRILDNPSTARKLSWRLRPVLRALVELDLERRDAVLALVRPRVLEEATDPVGRLVCARIFGRLGAGDDPAARTAAGVLLGALRGDLSPGEQIAALEDLAHLARHLPVETAAWLCGRLPEVAREAPPPALELLTLTCQRACEREPAESRPHETMARELLRRLTRQAGEETQELTLWHRLHAFAIVGVNLDRAEDDRSVAQLVDLAEKLDRPATVEAAADVVGVLAERLDDAPSATPAPGWGRSGARLVPATDDAWLLDGLARAAAGAAGGRRRPAGEAARRRPGDQAGRPGRRLALGEAFPRWQVGYQPARPPPGRGLHRRGGTAGHGARRAAAARPARDRLRRRGGLPRRRSGPAAAGVRDHAGEDGGHPGTAGGAGGGGHGRWAAGPRPAERSAVLGAFRRRSRPG
ncbi:MAG: serine/threonine-protein kinase [Gemmataceae bacterium]